VTSHSWNAIRRWQLASERDELEARAQVSISNTERLEELPELRVDRG